MARYDAGEIDVLELDDLIRHYKRATQKLWSFCVGAGGHVDMAARTLEWLRQEGELPELVGEGGDPATAWLRG